MGKNIKIKKGLDIRLEGEAEKVLIDGNRPAYVSVRPDDFIAMKPKVLVTAGTQVKAGTPLMFDKNNPEVMICSPVSGEVAEIVRGEKRVLLEVRILADKENSYISLSSASSIDALSKEQIVDTLCKNGAWAYIRQRPYASVANPQKTPKAIFISAFDSAPLAPDMDFIIQGNEKYVEAGIAAMKKLCANVHVNIHEQKTGSTVFKNASGAQVNSFNGPHPVGNIGVQIHHVDPINKGEIVWYVTPQDLIIIGKLLTEGKYDASRIVAVTGSEVKSRKYVKTIQGAPVQSIISESQLESGKCRFISGNALTGKNIGWAGSLGFYDCQVTVLPEGDEPEFFGWFAPGFDKFSLSRTFFTWAMPGKKFRLNTNMHGEHRAFVVTGEYEKVFPMDIYPVQLLKAIITNDIEAQENLGIYEVAPEDFALCEFVCTSKIESQEIVRKGLESLYLEEIESEKEHHH
jgi:Na+-transporting NADH:ubiquinone oxidoreductase subunit A